MSALASLLALKFSRRKLTQKSKGILLSVNCVSASSRIWSSFVSVNNLWINCELNALMGGETYLATEDSNPVNLLPEKLSSRRVDFLVSNASSNGCNRQRQIMDARGRLSPP